MDKEEEVHLRTLTPPLPLRVETVSEDSQDREESFLRRPT
jgi:hypothetical protein